MLTPVQVHTRLTTQTLYKDEKRQLKDDLALEGFEKPWSLHISLTLSLAIADLCLLVVGLAVLQILSKYVFFWKYKAAASSLIHTKNYDLSNTFFQLTLAWYPPCAPLLPSSPPPPSPNAPPSPIHQYWEQVNNVNRQCELSRQVYSLIGPRSRGKLVIGCWHDWSACPAGRAGASRREEESASSRHIPAPTELSAARCHRRAPPLRCCKHCNQTPPSNL